MANWASVIVLWTPRTRCTGPAELNHQNNQKIVLITWYSDVMLPRLQQNHLQEEPVITDSRLSHSQNNPTPTVMQWPEWDYRTNTKQITGDANRPHMTDPTQESKSNRKWTSHTQVATETGDDTLVSLDSLSQFTAQAKSFRDESRNTGLMKNAFRTQNTSVMTRNYKT